MNKKTILISLVLGVLLSISVLALTPYKPQKLVPLKPATPFLAIVPGEGTLQIVGEPCTNYWETWDHTCTSNGRFHVYKQCIQTYKGGEVGIRNEDCIAYGAGWVCQSNENNIGSCNYMGEVECKYNTDCTEKYGQGYICENFMCKKWTRSERINWYLLTFIIILGVILVIYGIKLYKEKRGG